MSNQNPYVSTSALLKSDLDNDLKFVWCSPTPLNGLIGMKRYTKRGPDGAQDDAPDGAPDGAPEGAPAGAPEGAPQDAPDGAPEGAPEGGF